MKFKSNIESQAGIEDSAGSAGTAGQILSSLGPVAGVDGVGWIDQADVVAAGATRVLIACKNTSGATITKGTPVYQTGNVGATDVIEIAEADALISTGYLPAIGLLETDLINNALGHVVITGELLNITTSPIDGVVPTTGDTIYLKSGGGLTLTKPTGEGNAIQNLGLVGKVSSGNAGSLTVASIMRQNDVPNLPTGKIWVGDGNTIVSDVVYLDETNERMGIKTTSPGATLEVQGKNSNTEAALKVTDSGDSFFEVVPNSTTTFKLGDIDAVGDEALIVGTFSDITFSKGGTTTMILDSNNRVGIGTTTPSTDLEVSSTGVNGVDISQSASNASQSGRLFFTTNTASEGFALFNSNGTFQVNSGGIPNNTSGTNRISIIGSSGNVGIGTTAPGAKLEVNGNTRIVGSLQLYLGSTSNQYLSISNAFGSTFINTGTSGETIFIGAPSAYQSNLQLQGDFIVRGGSSSTSIQTQSSTSVVTNKIVDSGISYFNAGNVGIGTTSPSDRLEVAAANSQLRLRDTDDNNFAQFSYSSGKLVVRNNSTTTTVNQFTLDSIGRMGIGTTSPNEKLEVNGSVRVTGAGLDVGYGNNSNNFVQIGNGRTTNGFAFIDLVGDTTYSDYGLRLVRNNGGANTNSEIIHRGTGALNLNVTQAGSITLKTSNVERVRVNSSGNVGIGTTTPATKLHVLGTTSSMPALGAAPSAAQLGGSTYGTLFSTLTSGRGVIQQGRSDGTAGSYDLLLQPVGGKVAIARTSATYTLDVGGTGRFTGDLRCLTLIQTSQRDQKENINDINKSKAKAIPFKEYTYKSSIDGSSKKRYGVIAEDIENHYPELVHTGADGVKGINYIDLLVKRVAELEKELEDISLTPGPKGANGSNGADGADGLAGADGVDGNSHLSNITSIAFNPKANRLQVNIGGTVYNFAPSK